MNSSSDISWNPRFNPSLPLEANRHKQVYGLPSRLEAVDLVSRDIEDNLSSQVEEKNWDFVVYDGNLFEVGASVVLTVDGDNGNVVKCWPRAE